MKKVFEDEFSEKYMEPTKNRMELLNQMAYLSKKILEDVWKVGYMYREECVHDVYQLDPYIWDYIDNTVGTELIRISSNEFEIDKKDKEIYMDKRKK